MSDTPDAISQAVGRALADAVGGEMVTRWVTLVEVIGEDGGRAMYTLTAPDAKAWDVLGMLSYATQVEQAATLRED